MSERYDRDRVLQGRISRTVLTSPKDAERYRTDAATHLQIQVLRDVLLLTDKAMEAEGVSREVRDRIVHWVLVGEPPPRWEEDPERELNQAVQKKIATRDALIQHLENLPITRPDVEHPFEVP